MTLQFSAYGLKCQAKKQRVRLINVVVVAKHIEEERKAGTKLVLPIATIIETGNHIAHATGNREVAVKELSDMIISAAKGDTPWIAIDMQQAL